MLQNNHILNPLPIIQQVFYLTLQKFQNNEVRIRTFFVLEEIGVPGGIPSVQLDDHMPFSRASVLCLN